MKIRYEREKLEQQALEAVREKLGHREEQTRKEHDAYMEEATRQIQAQRLRKLGPKKHPWFVILAAVPAIKPIILDVV